MSTVNYSTVCCTVVCTVQYSAVLVDLVEAGLAGLPVQGVAAGAVNIAAGLLGEQDDTEEEDDKEEEDE